MTTFLSYLLSIMLVAIFLSPGGKTARIGPLADNARNIADGEEWVIEPSAVEVFVRPSSTDTQPVTLSYGTNNRK